MIQTTQTSQISRQMMSLKFNGLPQMSVTRQHIGTVSGEMLDMRIRGV